MGKKLEKKTAIYAINSEGMALAKKIAGNLTNSALFVPERFCDGAKNIFGFRKNKLGSKVKENWHDYSFHLFIMSGGIVVRKIAPIIKNKFEDPAVVFCDENGAFVVSLLGGQIAGANKLAKEVAVITGGQAVISTSKAYQKLLPFDEFAELENLEIVDSGNIKVFNSMLLEGKRIGMMIPENIFKKYYKNVRMVELTDSFDDKRFDAYIVFDKEKSNLADQPVLKLRSKRKLALGIDFFEPLSEAELCNAFKAFVEDCGFDFGCFKIFAACNSLSKESALLDFVFKRNMPLEFFALGNNQNNFLDSKRILCEEVALAASGNKSLLVSQKKYGKITLAAAEMVDDQF